MASLSSLAGGHSLLPRGNSSKSPRPTSQGCRAKALPLPWLGEYTQEPQGLGSPELKMCPPPHCAKMKKTLPERAEASSVFRNPLIVQETRPFCQCTCPADPAKVKGNCPVHAGEAGLRRADPPPPGPPGPARLQHGLRASWASAPSSAPKRSL